MAKQRRVRTPSKGWHEVACGYIGDSLNWRSGYGELEDLGSYINLLCNLGSTPIDWDYLLKDLPRFAFLRDLLPRRSFGPIAYGEIDGVFATEGDRNQETGSMSGEYTEVRIDMDHSKKRAIFKDCDTLISRLHSYPPLQPYL